MLTICVPICIGLTIGSGDDLLQLSKRAILTNHSSAGAVTFSRDGTRIAREARGGIVVWDAKTGKKMSELVEAYNVHSLEFSHDNKLIANGTWNAVEVWDVKSGKLMQSFALSKSTSVWWQVADVHFTQDNKRIICAAWDKSERGQVFIGELKTGTILQKITFDASWFVTTASYPGEKELAVAHGDKISWWDMKGPTFSKTVQVEDEASDVRLGIMQLAVHPNGKLLVSGLYRVYIIGTDRNPRATNIRHQFVGIREGGKSLVTNETGQLHLWDYESQKRRQTITLSDDEDAIALSPDGRQLLTQRQRALTLWEFEKQR